MGKTADAINVMTVAGQKAIISYVPEIGRLRGKFLGLSGYCDFVADSIEELRSEGEISLRQYLEDCQENGIDPYEAEEKVKTFTLRYPESFGETLAYRAAESQMSVNAFVLNTLSERLKHS
ncbi:type II toxin-antitoxin system HicB family antitoxin [Budvicia diplopodorum]|uniref:type II toxin-antitoxin system HicB family antitoxin n=1 Tax=Budvicia diplopodorum TaxID=1119056 RepID=UPI001FE99E00|nr:type II toxin-antitoxin system HicB family antitoxin [Budvicia diplopodorum]